MSRYTSFHFRGEREGRVAQMTKQEEVIARKRQEILEKQRTTELAKQVVAAQVSSNATPSTSEQSIVNSTTIVDVQSPVAVAVAEPIPSKNNFNNDGSFLENFKKITEAAAKKAEVEKERRERDELIRKAIECGQNAENNKLT